MKAAILAIGSELLGTERLDTNSLMLTTALERFGVELVGKSVVGDDEERIAEELRRWAGRVDLVVVGGGLGPTADDVTRHGAARAFGRSLTIDEEIVDALRQRYARYGRRMPEVNRRQAEVIEGAEVVPNPRGSAPAQRLEADGTTVFLFPAVPTEIEGLIASCLEPWLRQTTGNDGSSGLVRQVLKIASRPESEIEEKIAPLYERFGRRGVTVLAAPGEVGIHLQADGSDDGRTRLAAMRELLDDLVGELVFTADADDTLEAVVGRLLASAGATVTTAESCTGGLVAERLTRVAGSSAWFLGGVVSYTNELKSTLLGVDPVVIERLGAVSEPVARAMAEGVRTRYKSDWGVGITGIAGPGGGSAEKPVGTVHLAVAGPGGTEHLEARFPGDRERVRRFSAQVVLEMLRRMLLDTS